ncbi:CLUMA_CG003675, isoform A [Clunio marinus]|uniref:CLUMA_CG003675, isoform A n=1 Tax=Clunio marinus TaxID=568069 RepID=A0A1J1HQX9_9DIPT|nr:CLUMA_CG003675, isoform A [Clunio marinus]
MTLPNLFLLINLGCEMLYIIDQRLTAQNIAKDKSALVLREVTMALLSPQFFQYIMTTFTEELISISQVRILLADIACCSLMRLDMQSLDKLLDLMIMVFKWQMFLLSNPDELLNVTFRHLNGIGKLIPEQGKMISIDQANQFFFTHWNELGEEQRCGTVKKLQKFLSPFNVRISLLMRMRLQLRDGSFVDKITGSSNDFFRYYVNNLGENIYEKINHFPQCQIVEAKSSKENMKGEIDCLFRQFNVMITEDQDEKETAKASNEIQNEVKIQNTTLDELRKKCKFDDIEEAPPVYEDNFEELLSMIDGNSK